MLIIAAFLAVAQPAPSAPAPWALDRREPMCVLDGLMADGGPSGSDRAALDAIMTACRQRFGWTEEQSHHGLGAAYVTASALVARNEAVEAGVAGNVIDDIVQSLSESERALLPRSGPSEEDARRFAAVILERLRAQGVTGEGGRKAAQAIVRLVLASRAIATFSREIGFGPEQAR